MTSIVSAAGAGTYEVRIEENNGGGSATVLTGKLEVSTAQCDAGCVAGPPPPPVGDGVSGNLMTASRGVGAGDVDITFDVGTCNSDHAVVLYGDIPDFSNYQGAVTTGCDAGNRGAATFNQAGSIWFLMHWVDAGNTAGFPGDATAGARTYTATGLCSVTADDTSDQTCN